MPRLTLYGKPGCCLCDEAREAVSVVRGTRQFELDEVDISLDPSLHRRYNERIPVLELDGEPVFELGVDARSLEDLLARVDT